MTMRPAEEVARPIAYLRDLDGTGSLHPCSKGDPGAIPVYDTAAIHEARREMRDACAGVADTRGKMSSAAYRRAKAAGRDGVASHRNSDSYTAAEIAALIRALPIGDET